MSKILLKKELMTMSRDEIIEIVMEMYSSRKDAKEYFEFFLNPDVDKLSDRYRERIAKEFMRSRRNCLKARISVIKRCIKEFASFNPGADYVVDLMLFTIENGIRTISIFRNTEKIEQSMLTVINDACVYADKQLVFNRFKDGIASILNNGTYIKSCFRHEISKTLSKNGMTV